LETRVNVASPGNKIKSSSTEPFLYILHYLCVLSKCNVVI
jgi:hypothetical protein